MMRWFGCAACLALSATACTPESLPSVSDMDVPATESEGDVVAAPAPTEAWFTDEFEHRLVHVGTDGQVWTLDLQGEPSGVVSLSSGRAAVALRAANQVVVVARGGDTLREVSRYDVGVEPYDLALTQEGLWVSASIDHRLELRDPESGDLLEQVGVDCEPRHLLAPHHASPAGLRVVSTCAREPWLHLVMADGVEAWPLPRRVWPGTEVCRPSQYRPRVHGQPAWHPSGDLLLPAQYLAPYAAAGCDTRRNDALDQIGLFEIGFRSREIDPIPFNAALIVMPLEERRPVRTLMTAAVTESGDRRGMLTGVVSDPTDIGQVWLASEGSAGFFWVRLDDGGGADSNAEAPAAGFERPARGWVGTGKGPYRLAALKGQVLGYSRLSSELMALDTASHQVDLVESFDISVSAEEESGRWMFYDGTHYRGSAPDLDLTCSGCHVDGRSDGLVWSLAFEAPRRVLPLAGRLSGRSRWTWSGVDAALEFEISDTQGNMLGNAIDMEDARDLTAFLRSLRAPQGRQHPQDVVELGQQVFVDVGCASCHLGRVRTDQSAHDFFGSEVMTPPLMGLVASPPYFHNAGAADLDAVLDTPEMASGVRTLTQRERDALLRYLETL